MYVRIEIVSSNLFIINENVNLFEMFKSFFYSFSNGFWLKMNYLMVISNSFIKYGDRKKEREIILM